MFGIVSVSSLSVCNPVIDPHDLNEANDAIDKYNYICGYILT